ncbi:MAG: DUF3857 domain-containing transglutaminase family protein [Marinifilum sp.]|jgi:transglutaminase-like putative cysteine protease|nr:DUF3857 domain-containing transglutaminase family protein [Marinifilum sp.]
MRLRHFYFITIALLLSINLSAKKITLYPTSAIPEELKKGADAIIRFDKTIIELNSIFDIKYKYERAITILNESGDKYADVYAAYSKTMPISNLQISIYDTNGYLIEKVKSSRINDYSASGENLFTDSRFKHYEPIQKNYPYTVVYSYSLSANEYFNIGNWHPYKGSRCAVSESIFTIVTDNPNIFKYKLYNSSLEPVITEDKGKSIYMWKVTNLKAYKPESYASPNSYKGPYLKCAPTKFQYDKINGSTYSWNELAKWFSKLNNGRDELDENTKAEIREMVKDCSSNLEKVKTLYEYLQNKTRYVSIQVGIGGQQPFPAQYVQDKSYGDCKALSNYMKALLKIIGLPSYYTLIYAGDKTSELDTSFVTTFANHAILMVPLKQDTIWLECTSKFSACGFLGSFTDDRTALAISENGGQLVRTPSYKISDNIQNKNGNIIINPDGTAKAIITQECRGVQYSNISSLTHVGPEDQKKKLYKDIDLPDFKINNHEVSKELTRVPSAVLKLDLNIRNYASKSGDRLFVPLNLITRNTSVPKKGKERKTDIYFKRGYCDTDTIQFILPEDYEMESIPEKKVIESDFGNYMSEAIKDGNKVTYIRKVVYKKFEFPAERYDDLRNYKKAVVRADKAKIVLKKIL